MTAKRTTAAKAPAPKKIGRPRKITPEVAKRMFKQLSLGRSLRTVCKDPGMPSLSTTMDWLLEDAEFADQYARSKKAGIELHVDSILDLADSATGENAHAVRLKVDTRKWLASKLLPKLYGDRVQVDADVAVREVIDPNDPRVSWQAKPLDRWTPPERIEAAKALGFRLALLRQQLASSGFDERLGDAAAALGLAIVEAAQGRSPAPPPPAHALHALPAPPEKDITPPPGGPDEPRGPMDNISWPPSPGPSAESPEAFGAKTYAAGAAKRARTARDIAETEAYGRPLTAEERLEYDAGIAKINRQADRLSEAARRPKVIGGGASLTAARRRGGF
jgi:hypothetical protein